MFAGPIQTLGMSAPPSGPESLPPSPVTPIPAIGHSVSGGCSDPQSPTPQQALPPAPLVSAMCGNPINAATGNKFEAETDFIGGTQTGLEFIRYYNSQDTAVTSLGARWRTTWQRSLNVSGNTVTVTRADGHQDVFTKKGKIYTSDPDVTSTLTAILKGLNVAYYQVTTASDAVETYTASGQFISLQTRAGLTTTLTYDTRNNLTKVTGPFGHTLTFTIGANQRITKMTVPDGGVYSYAYDKFGNLVSVTHPDKTVRKYVYGNATYPNFLTGIIDENGSRFATWTYDTMGRAITSEHAGGVELTSVAYATNASTVTDANGAAHTYNFETQFNVIKPISLTGVPIPVLGGDAFTYDAKGFLSGLTDYDGNVTGYTHNTLGEETSRTLGSSSALALTVSTTWHSTFHLPTQIVDGSRTFTFVYDANGNLKSKTITAPSTNSTWSYTYNASGQARTATDPLGNLTTYGYDASGDLTSIENPFGQITTITSYDADGRPLSTTDPNGLVTTLTYNWRGEVTSRTVGGWLTSYTYDSAGQLTKLTRPDGSYLAFTYDPAHRLTGVADALGNRVAYTLNTSSDLIKEQVFSVSTTQVFTHSFTYDAVNRLAKSIGALKQTTTYSYDANSNLTQILDPLADVTKQAFDALNRLSTSTDAKGGIVAFGYDPQNRVTQVTDPRGLATSHGYNGLDEPTSTISPDSGGVAKTYDAAGNVLTSTDARGKTTKYSYDALNRIAKTAFADGSAATYGYDQGVNGIGHLTSMTDTTGTTAWAYEIHGLVTAKTQTNGAVKLTTLSTYDAFGRLTGLTYPSGAAFGYGYNANGQISGVSYLPAGSKAASALISQIGYQPFGPVNGWSMGNGATYARSFDQDGRISGLTLPANDTIAVTYDAASRIKALTETGLATKTFGYDKLNRLTGYASGTNSETFSYDADGNRSRAVSVTGSTTVSDIYSYDTKSNRLLKIAGNVSESVLKLAGTVASETFGYDKSGNTTGDAIAASDFVYTYDAKNRLAESKNSELSLAYGINGLGQRTSKSNTSTGSTTAARVSLSYDPPQTYFVYDGARHLIGQYDGSGVVQQETVWLGDLPVATIQAGTAYYIAPDHLGAPHQVTDGTKSVVWFWDHDPFGTAAPTGTLTYSLRFPGQFYDPLTGLSYNGFRDYDSATGRYVESDPIGLAGGVNTYGYVGGNPAGEIDPTGEFFLNDIPVIIRFMATGGPAILRACISDPNCQIALTQFNNKLAEDITEASEWHEKIIDPLMEKIEEHLNTGSNENVCRAVPPDPFSLSDPNTPFGPANMSPITNICLANNSCSSR